MQCSVPFVQQSLCLQWWDNGLHRWVYNSCTVRFVYRIFEYSFVLGIFDSLGFRIFILALQWRLSMQDINFGWLEGEGTLAKEQTSISP